MSQMNNVGFNDGSKDFWYIDPTTGAWNTISMLYKVSNTTSVAWASRLLYVLASV